MKRRDFIINSALAIGGASLLSGCGKKEIKKSENQVLRRKFHNTTMPLIALGCMRLPMRNGFINNRVRLYDNLVRIEIPQNEFINFLKIKSEIIDKFKQYNISYITLDIEGLRKGSMDI